ncbi:hypothetical protein [Ruminiclostridium josui]|uniref:hypothetical protein n=1 Tax=Ruminiclostridium josui TaxID=1499 RepID=UPI00046625D4|nr:hypothetical protein [Ruminiclostridium josui]
MNLKKSKSNNNAKASEVPIFSKEQIISCKRYAGRKDLLNVLLESNKMYSFDEVDNSINNFLKGKVN